MTEDDGIIVAAFDKKRPQVRQCIPQPIDRGTTVFEDDGCSAFSDRTDRREKPAQPSITPAQPHPR